METSTIHPIRGDMVDLKSEEFEPILLGGEKLNKPGIRSYKIYFFLKRIVSFMTITLKMSTIRRPLTLLMQDTLQQKKLVLAG